MMIPTLVLSMFLADPVFLQQQRLNYVIACGKTCHNMLCDEKSCREIPSIFVPVEQKMIGFQPRLALSDRPDRADKRLQSHYQDAVAAAYNATHGRCPVRQDRRRR